MKFLSSNETLWRLLRTILQAVCGVVIANLDVIIQAIEISDTWKPVIVALVMAILSPIMSEIGKGVEKAEEKKKLTEKEEAGGSKP